MKQIKPRTTVYRVTHPLGSKAFDTYYDMCEEATRIARAEATYRLEVEIWMLAHSIAQEIFDTVEEIELEP